MVWPGMAENDQAQRKWQLQNCVVALSSFRDILQCHLWPKDSSVPFFFSFSVPWKTCVSKGTVCICLSCTTTTPVCLSQLPNQQNLGAIVTTVLHVSQNVFHLSTAGATVGHRVKHKPLTNGDAAMWAPGANALQSGVGDNIALPLSIHQRVAENLQVCSAPVDRSFRRSCLCHCPRE